MGVLKPKKRVKLAPPKPTPTIRVRVIDPPVKAIQSPLSRKNR